jgi:chlorobactene glucosyltransferase
LSAAVVVGLVAGPSIAIAALVLLNLRWWPRGRADGSMPGPVSILVPARNEADGIEACVRAALRSTVPPAEVLVYDDGSDDGTAGVVERIAGEDARVRLLRGVPLPPGWVGKPHACHRLAEAATGDVLVFVDADTVLEPAAMARLGSVLEEYDADLASAGVRQVTRTAGERLVVPLLHLSYLAWLPLPLVWRTSDPRMTVANGQLLAVRREAYHRAGGWSAARDQVVDDMALARAVKRAGLRVVFADGHLMASCRMYGGMRDAWEGFSKNLYPGIGGRPGSLIAVLLLHAWVFVLPYAALLAAALGAGWLLAAGATGVAANLAMRVAMVVRLRQPPLAAVLHPIAVLVLMAIAVNSWRWSRAGRIRWRGRVYAPAGAPPGPA